MNIEQFRGTTVALVTPFTKNGKIDEIKLRMLVDRQIELGTNVILACGTTGESATLSHEEHHHVMDIVIEQVNDRVPVICGAGSNATHEAISLSKHAEAQGADAILSVGPYYNKPTQEGFYRHFRTIAESVSIPLIIYNVPGRTGSNIETKTVLRLAEIDNIIGIKEASGNMSQIMNILRSRPEDFLVLSGDDALSLALIALGGDGTISVIANETPDRFSQMISAALNGDWNRARQVHEQLLPLMEANFIESNPIPVKTALAMMGIIEDNFRLPLVTMAPHNREILQTILSDLNLLNSNNHS
ncbi:MAG TPA: 4-hydroxy-tetrahydrodipicolinate synthase [Candidatus Marinimicrobia bacterium]|nr:4-hydroxy-tetrahydrodipicolinate synthase [Candidatus Neomarinimicrobiota bacterium]